MAQHVAGTQKVVEGAAPGLVHNEQRVEHGLQGGPATHAGMVPEPGSGGMVGSVAGPSGQAPHGMAAHEQAIPAETAVPVISAEERERQLAADEMRLRAKEEKLTKHADAYVEKKQRDAQAHVQHEIAKADKNAEKAISKAAHKEATVHKKVEQKLAQAEQDRKKAEIDAEHKAAEKKAEAQQEAEGMIAAAKEKAEAIRRGDEVPEKPSAIKKIFGMA